VTSQNPENGVSPDSRHPDCRFVIDNAEAFALGALDRADQSRIEQHLILCGPCRRAIAEVRRVTNLLPFLAAPAVPSPSVKRALFERIADAPPQPEPVMNPWIPRSEAAPEPASLTRKAATSPTLWQRWLPTTLVAPLAIALLILAAWANSLRNEVSYLEAEREQQTALAGSMAGDGTMQLYAFKPACETCAKKASGRFGGNPDGSVGVVIAWNLDPNERHQVWCVDEKGEKWLVSNLDVAPSGSVFQTVSFPEPLAGYQQIYLARHDGTADPDAELLVALNEQGGEDEPAAEPAVPTGT